MGLKGISSAAPTEARDLLGDAPFAIVRVEADGRHAVVLSDGPNAKAGSRLRLVDARAGRGPALDAVLEGRPAAGDQKAVPRTGPGDVIVFNAALRQGDDLLCGAAVARLHDGMRGPLQAMRILARPTALAVTDKGAIQSVVLADPSLAETVSTQAGLSDFLARMAARDWPGGKPGLILRHVPKPGGRLTAEEASVAHEVAPEPRESLQAFARRLAVDNEILSGGPVEAIPTWRMPLSGAHMFREGISLKTPLPRPKAGAVTRQYMSGGTYPKLGFQPSFVLLADDDEWTFGAKSGKVVRTCAGLQPLRTGDPLAKADMATPSRPVGTDGRKRAVVAGLSLFKGDEVERAALARAARRGEGPETARAVQPSVQPPLGRPPGPGRGPAREDGAGHHAEETRGRPISGLGGGWRKERPAAPQQAARPPVAPVAPRPAPAAQARPRPAPPRTPPMPPRVPGMR